MSATQPAATPGVDQADTRVSEGEMGVRAWWVVGLFLASVLGIFLLHPRISIPDIDAHAAVIAAKSLQRSEGYRDLHGAPLNHWPPGYSFLLSLAPDPIRAALIINYGAFGAAVVMLFLLATEAGWSARLAVSCALALGFGLLRLLACMAKPDILTFFIFLLAAWLYLKKGNLARLVAYLLWGVLIPVKLIAVVFTPGALLADWWLSGHRQFWRRVPQHVAALGFWLLFAGVVLAFNYFTVHAWSSPTYVDFSVGGLLKEIKRFAGSVFVGFLAVWYGPIRQAHVVGPVVLTIWAGMLAVSTLQRSPRGKPLLALGGAILLLSWFLEMARLYYADARLMGYGMILMLLGFVPRGRFLWSWFAYAAAVVVLALYNVFSIVSVGTNHSAYAEVAGKIAAVGLPNGPKVSNSFHLLDVHAGIPTRPALFVDQLPRGTVYIKITLPNYDGLAHTVWPAATLDASWREVASLEGATVYQKTEGPAVGELPPAELNVVY
jgi:hypothetical protein